MITFLYRIVLHILIVYFINLNGILKHLVGADNVCRARAFVLPTLALASQGLIHGHKIARAFRPLAVEDYRYLVNCETVSYVRMRLYHIGIFNRIIL